MNLARTERAALADLLEQVGPDRPTLCEGWTTADLLAHLLVRERRPDAAVGLMVPWFAGHTESVMAATKKRPWAEQLAELRAGPPAWNPTGYGKIDELANGAEMLVHHEDVRRGEEPWEARDLDPATHAAVVGLLRNPMVRMAFKAAPGGVTIRITDGPEVEVITLRTGAQTVEIAGGVVDVILWAVGRSAVRLDFDGPPEAIAKLQESRRGR